MLLLSIPHFRIPFARRYDDHDGEGAFNSSF